MSRLACITCVSFCAVLAASAVSLAQQPQTLMGRMAEWQYPGSKFTGATASDAATIDKNGNRTVPSIQSRAVWTTKDTVAKVMEYYKSQLTPKPEDDKAKRADKPAPESARSVTFHEDSENRPVAIHMILINTAHTSTTLVISRAETETETHIAWTQYARLLPNGE